MHIRDIIALRVSRVPERTGLPRTCIAEDCETRFVTPVKRGRPSVYCDPCAATKRAESKQAQRKRYRAKHGRKWAKAHPERVRATANAWYSRLTPEQRKARRSRCALSRRASRAARRAAKLQRTPAWADRAAVREFYALCPRGHHVDHACPRQPPVPSRSRESFKRGAILPRRNLLKLKGMSEPSPPDPHYSTDRPKPS